MTRRIGAAGLAAALLFAVPAHANKASWYGGKFHGRLTASGERYDMHAMTCAHKTLRFNTRVRVTNLRNGKSAICRVTDRGPFVRGRIIDVSRGMAVKLGMLKSGVVPVRLQIIK